MKKLTALLLILAMLIPFTACGTDPVPPADSTDPADTTPAETDPAVTEPAETEPAYDAVEPMGDFELVLGDPVVVSLGEPGNMGWGYHQFPGLYPTKYGHIVATWNQGEDNILYEGTTSCRISTDNGATWEKTEEYDSVSVRVPMPNGKYFAGFIVYGSHPQGYLHNYKPAADYGYLKLYFRSAIADNPEAFKDTIALAREYDPETGEYKTFRTQINWPNAPLARMGDLVYPFQMIFALQNHAAVAVGDDLYLPIYFYGFDSNADRKDAVMELSHKYSVYFFKSSDSGRTWDFLSQVYTTQEHTPNFAEGVCEPTMTVMPDGSFLMLMRTGGNNPSYMVRSTDGGVTWSDPVLFDTIGVLPQLLTLDCGVTISTYGRPIMKMRATSDPTGLTWEDPMTIPLKGGSCHYTDLIKIDGNTALWIYSDFGYKTADGQPVKAIITRTITVVPKGK